MKKNPAFTLFELVVYCGVISIIIPMIFSFFSRGIYEVRKTIGIKETHVKNTIALSVLRSDVISASMSRHEWEDNCFVFKKYYRTMQGEFVEQWVGWECCNEGLKRSSGLWDNVEGQWHKKSTSIYHCDITDLHLKKTGTKNTLQGIVLTYSLKNVIDHQTMYIRLRNRMIA